MSTRPGGQARRSTRPLNAPETLIGRVLDGRFRLDRVLSAGGMGIVFEAKQLTIQRVVAVKLLKPTLTSDMEVLQRFFQEVEVVTNLQHPNIVATVDAGKDAGGLAYLVMEYFDGDTFREVLQRFELTLPDILDVFIQVCDALIEAHACQIIHRDLKFDNIMVKRLRDGNIHVKILDFGVAKLLSSDQDLTRGGQVPGTPGIIAPELVEKNEPTPRSDLYSLGVLLFTAMAGQAPYRAKNDLALMHAHQTQPIPDLKTLVGPDVPDMLISFIYKLMAKTPDERPEDAQSTKAMLLRIRTMLIDQHPVAQPYVPLQFISDESLALNSGAFNINRIEMSQEIEQEYMNNYADVLNDDPNASPILVPSSVVGALVFLLIVLVVICLILLHQLFLVPK